MKRLIIINQKDIGNTEAKYDIVYTCSTCAYQPGEQFQLGLILLLALLCYGTIELRLLEWQQIYIQALLQSLRQLL